MAEIITTITVFLYQKIEERCLELRLKRQALKETGITAA